jgi:hypothetical protein
LSINKILTARTFLLNEGKLQPADRNEIVDAILDMLNKIYTTIISKHGVSPGKIMCNAYTLDQALIRYSRDIFGESRLKAKIDDLKSKGRLTNEQQEVLSEFKDYGFKTDSCSPYFHRQVANLLYWLSMLKPFAVYPDDASSATRGLGLAFMYHNEYISYLLILAMLKTFNQTLNIHHNKQMFHDFLYDLHFRNLSRSSLEFFPVRQSCRCVRHNLKNLRETVLTLKARQALQFYL